MKSFFFFPPLPNFSGGMFVLVEMAQILYLPYGQKKFLGITKTNFPVQTGAKDGSTCTHH